MRSFFMAAEGSGLAGQFRIGCRFPGNGLADFLQISNQGYDLFLGLSLYIAADRLTVSRLELILDPGDFVVGRLVPGCMGRKAADRFSGLRILRLQVLHSSEC